MRVHRGKELYAHLTVVKTQLTQAQDRLAKERQRLQAIESSNSMMGNEGDDDGEQMRSIIRPAPGPPEEQLKGQSSSIEGANSHPKGAALEIEPSQNAIADNHNYPSLSQLLSQVTDLTLQYNALSG